MTISSNTLFHFTKSRSNLENILTNRFKLSYCKETINVGDKNLGDLHLPMISFCDIPLAQAKDHISKYGNYAIGMAKEWGIKNKLNPVLYLEKNSNLTENIFDLLSIIENLTNATNSITKEDSTYSKH